MYDLPFKIVLSSLFCDLNKRSQILHHKWHNMLVHVVNLYYSVVGSMTNKSVLDKEMEKSFNNHAVIKVENLLYNVQPV